MNASKFTLPSFHYTLSLATIILAFILLPSCGNKKQKSQWPDNFSSIGDSGRVNYLIKVTSPDSVARFIINGALGKVPGAKIDSLAIATNAAYEKLSGEDAEKFAIAYDGLVASLSLPEKAKVMVMAGTEDPQGLGYRLGLEYLSSVRDNNMSVDEVKNEIKAFEIACGNDTSTYRRFIIGFKTVLKVDSGKDVKKEIYNTFINY